MTDKKLKTLHSISSPEESSAQFEVLVRKQGWNETSCNAQDRQATIRYLPPAPSPFDEPTNADISDSYRSAPV